MSWKVIDKSGDFPSGSLPLSEREAKDLALSLAQKWEERGFAHAINIEVIDPQGRVEYWDSMCLGSRP